MWITFNAGSTFRKWTMISRKMLSMSTKFNALVRVKKVGINLVLPFAKDEPELNWPLKLGILQQMEPMWGIQWEKAFEMCLYYKCQSYQNWESPMITIAPIKTMWASYLQDPKVPLENPNTNSKWEHGLLHEGFMQLHQI